MFGHAQEMATLTLDEARLGAEVAPDPRLVAKRLGVVLATAPARAILGGVAQAGRLGSGFVIRRASGLPEPLARFAVAHELGHIAVMRHGLTTADEEAWCNAYAGALLLPREPLAETWRRGHDLGDVLERWTNVPPTCVALRVGEAGLAGTLVVQGLAVRYTRGVRSHAPELVTLGAEAARTGRARSGVANAWRLADRAGRAAVALVA